MSALVAPKALEALLERTLSSQTGSPESEYAKEYLLRKVFSKYTTGAIPKKAEEKALEKFLSHSFRMANFKIEPKSIEDDWLHDCFRNRAWRFFDGIDLDEMSLSALHQRGGVGPGASIAAHGTDFLRKLYYGPVSATSLDVLHSYLRGCATNPLDLQAAKRSLAVFGSVVSQCSRTSFVEKNVDEARTIATEPSVNMFYQLAIGSVIDDRLRRVYGFSKTFTHERNRKLAHKGSVDGSLATIDLQSASDSVSLQLVEGFLPSWWVACLHRYRCEYSRMPDGRILRLPMVSTMGNGWTFSLMTALLYCALHAAVDVFGDPEDIRRCSVYGDDIICPTGPVYRGVIRILAMLGFVVNAEKSFSEGDFRESCGHDYLRGRFVRPVYIRRLDTTDSLYVAINRLSEWGAFHGFHMTTVLRYLAEKVPRVFVPPEADYSSGIRVPSTVASKFYRNGVWRYKRYEAVPVDYDVTDEPRRARSLSPGVNPDGCFVAFIGGYLRNGRITERSERKVKWRLSTRVSLYWGFRHADPCPGWDDEAERRWKVALTCLAS